MASLATRFPSTAKNIDRVNFHYGPEPMMSDGSWGIAGWGTDAGGRALTTMDIDVGSIDRTVQAIKAGRSVKAGRTFTRLDSLDEAVQDTFTHEFGHHVDMGRGASLAGDIRTPGAPESAPSVINPLLELSGAPKNLPSSVAIKHVRPGSMSPYGMSDQQEFVAEGFLRAHQPGASRGLQDWLTGLENTEHMAVRPDVQGVVRGLDEAYGPQGWGGPSKGRFSVPDVRRTKTVADDPDWFRDPNIPFTHKEAQVYAAWRAEVAAGNKPVREHMMREANILHRQGKASATRSRAAQDMQNSIRLNGLGRGR
jgi:hypothetical protein